jgi:hypothetical protein
MSHLAVVMWDTKIVSRWGHTEQGNRRDQPTQRTAIRPRADSAFGE